MRWELLINYATLVAIAYLSVYKYPLSAIQEEVIVQFLDILAFDEDSDYQDYAMQVLEEYWIPGAIYREKEYGGDIASKNNAKK